MNTFLRFPGGRFKALTLSYDDGVEQDIRLSEIMAKNGIRGTFNINSGLFAPEGKVYPAGQVHRRMSRSQIYGLFKDSGNEVAVHGFTHPFLESIPTATAAMEVIDDRKALEALFGRIIRGMAYPFGTWNERLLSILKDAGIAYSRTTKATHGFGLPANWLLLDPTCHHNDPELPALCDKFLAMDKSNFPQMFYLWGHSYEFEGKDNWNVIEDFCAKMGGHDNIWYATNIEICDYVNAYGRLQYSVDGKIIHNPTDIDLWVNLDQETVMIPAGQTVTR